MASKNKFIQGNLRVSDKIYEDGLSLSSKYAQDSNVVHKGRDETITGNKTFNGVNTFNGNAQFKYVRIDNNWDSYGEINSKKAIWNNGIILDGTLDLHPEGNPIIFPYYMNDLAYLIKKGGSCVVKYKPENGTDWSTISSVNIDSLFDGTSSYTGYTVNSLNDTVVIVIKAHKTFSFNTRVGISSGSGYWRAKNIQIDMGYMADTSNFDSIVDTLINAEADESGLTTTNVTTTKTWVTRARATDYAYGTYFSIANGPMINGTPSWNIIRITLTNFNNTRSEADIAAGKQNNNRFAGVFALCYDSEGLNTTLLGRKGGEMYGDIYPYKDKGTSLGYADKRFKDIYGETGHFNAIVPYGNDTGSIGNSASKWWAIRAHYINGDALQENGINIRNIFSERSKLLLGRNSDTVTTNCCSFFIMTFDKPWNRSYFTLDIKDIESAQIEARYVITFNVQDTVDKVGCNIRQVYGHVKERIKIFAVQNNNQLTFYLKLIDTSYCHPILYMRDFNIIGGSYEFTPGTWTEEIPTATFTETNILDLRYVQKQSYAHTYAAKVYGFDNQGTQNVWNVGMTAAGYTIPYRLENGQLSVGTPTANEHATTKEYVDTNYIPKKSINNAYQAIVDNSGAAFTVTAGLSNNTGQTILKIAPSGTATINDKQIATTDDIPSYGNATTTTSGLMSASDKTTLTALTCKSESKDIALGLTSLIGGQTVNPITANITDRSFFSKIIDLMRAGQVVTGFYLQLGNYYTFLKLFFANLEGGYENLSFEITDANDNSCVSYGINYDASNYIITFNKRDASIADALVDDNGTTYYYNSFALSSHNQASNTINAMTNYSKPTSTSAIKATDSLNTAIGKLEKALDGKGTSNFTGYTSSNKLSTSYIQNDAKWTSNAGTVTSVRVQATSPVVSSSNTAQTSSLNTTISLADGYGDTKNPYASKTKNYVLAAPNGKAGVPSFRSLVAADIPSLPSNKITAMTGYSKVSSASAIKATDSLNTAIGKLEKALDGKGTSNLTLGTTATTAAAGDHTHSVATTSANGLMSKEDKTKLDTISHNYVKAYNTGKNGMPGTITNNGSSIYIDSGNDSINVIGEGDEHGVGISVGDNNFVNFYQDRTEMIDAPVKIKQIQAPTASNGSTYGLGTSGQVLKSNGTSVYWANDSTTTYPTFTRGSTDFSPAYTLTAKDAGFIHTWWRCSSNLYASCNFGNVIAVSATNLFPMQKYSPGTNTSNQTTAYQKSVSSGSRSYSNNSFNAFQIPQRGDMVIDQYGCIGVIESDPTTVVSTYSVRLVWKSIKDWSCLEKGTQITLADGTYKNIEDVRQGESIMGWDFEKNEPCEAIALFADAAQADEKTTYLVLDNGEILSMTDGHTLYSKNLERYIPINDLREGDILMGKDGEDVEVVSIHWNIHTFGIRQFYHVVSSNNTYFANNTLNAIHPVDKYNWLQNRSSEVVPDEILAIFEQDKGEFDCFDFTIKNKEFLALTSKHQSTLKKHRNKIGDLKNYLTNTDYVAIKMFEGLEVDETILDIRKEKRKEINALEKEIEKIEKEYNNLLVQYSDLGEDMLLSDNARRSKYFKVACKNDNEHLDLFKKYYPLKDEAYILKEIEEGKANRPITEVIEEEENE